MDTALSDQQVRVVRPDCEVLTRQRLPYFIGVSGDTVGVIEGRVETRYGTGLQCSVASEACDFLFIPPDVPHEALNLGPTEPARAIVARNDHAEQDNVVPYEP
jgi:uncharacterized RmlC-like cupin family protein